MNSAPPEIAALLEQLQDLQTPPEISAWPPAIGWWIMTFAGLAIIYFAIHQIVLFVKKYRWKQLLLKELHLINIQQQNEPFCQQINQLLKRIVRLRFKEENTTSLAGDAWVNWLEEKFSDKATRINLAPLGTASYQPNAQINKEQLLNDVKEWIVSCH